MSRRPVTVAVLSLLVSMVPFTPRAAASGVPIELAGLQGASDIEIGPDRVFVLTHQVIAVRDLAGAPIGTIPSVGGAVDMLLHGSDLYVIRCSEFDETPTGTIDVYDVSGSLPYPKVSHTLDVPTTRTAAFAWAGGKAWFLAGASNQVLASIAPNGSISSTANVDGHGAKLIESSPSRPNDLWLVEDIAMLHVDITSGSPSVAASSGYISTIFEYWAAMPADGSELIVPHSDYKKGAWRYDSDTFATKAPNYVTDRIPLGGDVNPVDGSVALTTPHVNSGTDLRVFDSDGTEILTQTLSKQYISFADNARFSPDGSRLYVTLNDEDTLQAYLVVVPAGATKAGLSIKGPRTVTFGDAPKYSAHLAVFSDVSNLQVRIYTQLVGGPKELFKTGEVDANGDLFFRPDLPRETLVTAEWDGDGAYLADSLEIDIGVRVAMEPTIRRWYARSGHTYLFHTGSRPIYSVKVRPNESGREVTFELQSQSSGSWRTVTFVRLDLSPTSKVGVSISGLRTGTPYRIQASMHGTGQNLGNHTPWTYLKVT